MSIEYIVIIILLFLSFGLILYFFIAGPTREYDRAAVESSCRASVLAAVHSDTWDAEALECPTNYVAFDGDSPLEVEKRVAEGLASCWRRFGEGELLLFEHEPSVLGTDKVSYCNVCEVYSFTDIESFSGLSEYLVQHRVAKEYSVEQPKYVEYLAGEQFEDEQLAELATFAATQQIDTSHSYAALFTYGKDPSYLRQKYLLKEAFASRNPFRLIYYGTLALAFGKDVGAEWTAQIAFIPYDAAEIRALCENIKE